VVLPDRTVHCKHPGYQTAAQLAATLKAVPGPPPCPKEAEEAADEEALTEMPVQNFGVDLDRLAGGPSYKLTRKDGEHALTQAEAFELMATGLPDDSKKSRLTVIGSDAERKPVEDDLAKPENADLRDKTILWSVRPDHWSVRDGGWAPGTPAVYLQPPKGANIKVSQVDPATKKKSLVTVAALGDEVLYREPEYKTGDLQAIRKKLPDYDPSKDPGRRPKVAKLQIQAVNGKRVGGRGDRLHFRVRALDADGNPVTDFSGPVKLSSPSSSAELPAEIQLEGGTALFDATFKGVGDHVVMAADKTAADVAGVSESITIKPKAVKLRLEPADGKTSCSRGESLRFRVKALDVDGNPVPGYAGPVKLSGSPSSVTLVDGLGQFDSKFDSAGDQQLTVAADDVAPDALTITVLSISIPPALVMSALAAVIVAVIAVNKRKQ